MSSGLVRLPRHPPVAEKQQQEARTDRIALQRHGIEALAHTRKVALRFEQQVAHILTTATTAAANEHKGQDSHTRGEQASQTAEKNSLQRSGGRAPPDLDVVH